MKQNGEKDLYIALVKQPKSDIFFSDGYISYEELFKKNVQNTQRSQDIEFLGESSIEIDGEIVNGISFYYKKENKFCDFFTFPNKKLTIIFNYYQEDYKYFRDLLQRIHSVK